MHEFTLIQAFCAGAVATIVLIVLLFVYLPLWLSGTISQEEERREP